MRPRTGFSPRGLLGFCSIPNIMMGLQSREGLRALYYKYSFATVPNASLLPPTFLGRVATHHIWNNKKVTFYTKSHIL